MPEYLVDAEKEWKVMNKMKKDPRATMKALGRGMLNMVEKRVTADRETGRCKLFPTSQMWSATTWSGKESKDGRLW